MNLILLMVSKDIIKNCRVYNNLESSVKKIDYLIATTSRFRNKNIKHIKLKDLNKIDYTNKIAFLFGSEASGLSNNEISYANYTLQIPTNPNFKSLNLSHSVIIIAQILASIIKLETSKYSMSKKVKSAKKKQYLYTSKKSETISMTFPNGCSEAHFS